MPRILIDEELDILNKIATGSLRPEVSNSITTADSAIRYIDNLLSILEDNLGSRIEITYVNAARSFINELGITYEDGEVINFPMQTEVNIPRAQEAIPFAEAQVTTEGGLLSLLASIFSCCSSRDAISSQVIDSFIPGQGQRFGYDHPDDDSVF